MFCQKGSDHCINSIFATNNWYFLLFCLHSHFDGSKLMKKVGFDYFMIIEFAQLGKKQVKFPSFLPIFAFLLSTLSNFGYFWSGALFGCLIPI